MLLCFVLIFPPSPVNNLSRYDILSDGLDDVAVDNNMNTQTTLEDEEALDPIDDIWQEEESSSSANTSKYKIRQKTLARPYVAYEPLNNNCDSLKTWSTTRFHSMLAATINSKLLEWWKNVVESSF